MARKLLIIESESLITVVGGYSELTRLFANKYISTRLLLW